MQAQEHEYDIIGHPQLNFSFVVVFPFHPYTDGRRGGQVSFQHLQLKQPQLQHLMGSLALSCISERELGTGSRAIHAQGLCPHGGALIFASVSGPCMDKSPVSLISIQIASKRRWKSFSLVGDAGEGALPEAKRYIADAAQWGSEPMQVTSFLNSKVLSSLQKVKLPTAAGDAGEGALPGTECNAVDAAHGG